jgi:hypothetical protein
MRRNSHIQLSEFLAKSYMGGIPKRCILAFKTGCIGPDMNPTTYLKGSRRVKCLHGHNFRNAEKYMKKASRRLEERGVKGMISFYRLGRLVHYITDGFTFAHNENFDGDIREHSRYEHGLHEFFPDYLRTRGESLRAHASVGPVFRIIKNHHREYIRHPSNHEKDSRYAILATLSVVERVMSKARCAIKDHVDTQVHKIQHGEALHAHGKNRHGVQH